MTNAFQTVLLGVATGYILYLMTKPSEAAPQSASNTTGTVVIGVPGQSPVSLRSSYVDGLGDVYTNAGIIRGANPAPPVRMSASQQVTRKFPGNPQNTRPVMTPQTVNPLANFVPASEASKYTLNKPATEITSAELAYMRANPGKPTAAGTFNPMPGPTLRTGSAMQSSNNAPVYHNGAYTGTVAQVAQAMIQNATGNPNITPAALQRAAGQSMDPGYQQAVQLALRSLNG